MEFPNFDRALDEPDDDTPMPEDDVVTCVVCDGILHGTDAYRHRGQWYCDDHYYELPEVVEGIEAEALYDQWHDDN